MLGGIRIHQSCKQVYAPESMDADRCRGWNELGEDRYVLKHLSLHEFKEWKLLVPESEEYKRKSSWLVNKCADAGNLEALYRKGLVGYLGGLEPEKGLQWLKNAANAGHGGAEYAAAMISILRGDKKGWKKGTRRLKAMMKCKELRKKAIDASRQLMFTHIKAGDYRLRTLPVKRSDRRCCTSCRHEFRLGKIMAVAFKEEGKGCRRCICDAHILRAYMIMSTNGYTVHNGGGAPHVVGGASRSGISGGLERGGESGSGRLTRVVNGGAVIVVLVGYLGGSEPEKGLQWLNDAANAGHGGAEYAAAMISILRGSEEGWESGTLRLKGMMQCKELRKKAIDAHRQMINTHVKARDYRLRTLPVNWSPHRRYCTDSHHELQFLKVMGAVFKGEEVGCRGWNELGEDGYVLKHLSLHEFKEWKVSASESEEYKRKSSWLVNKCAGAGNVEALYRKGLVGYLGGTEPEKRLQWLNSAANAGHAGAEYAAATISILRGSEEGWESGTFRLKGMMQCKELRKKAIDAHRQMMSTHIKAGDYRLRTLPVNWSPRRRFCTDSHHELQFLNVMVAVFKGEEVGCLCCICDAHILRSYMIITSADGYTKHNDGTVTLRRPAPQHQQG
nr:putative F-box protein At1g67623 [Ipomoea batatas]